MTRDSMPASSALLRKGRSLAALIYTLPAKATRLRKVLRGGVRYP